MLISIWNGTPEYLNAGIPQFKATLNPFLSQVSDGTSVIIIPGGGYRKKAWDHEGIQIAEWLNQNGIHAFVLDYRIAPYSGNAILSDAQRAIRWVRYHASEYSLNPERIGILGFSAGGHLAGCTATMFDFGKDGDSINQVSCRPDFAVLGYPVISMDTSITHRETQRIFTGSEAPALEQREQASVDCRVTSDTPPLFIWHTAQDKAVSPEHSVRLFQACLKHHVPVELHIFPEGPHGLGIPRDMPHVAQWANLCIHWIRQIKRPV